jgi:hypothetical protein
VGQVKRGKPLQHVVELAGRAAAVTLLLGAQRYQALRPGYIWPQTLTAF